MIKTPEELQGIRASCQLLARIFAETIPLVRAGVTTADLDRFVDGRIREVGAIPVFNGYLGYPASICTSINEVVVHGMPGDTTLQEGDIIGIDMGLRFQGMVSDMAMTLGVGTIDAESSRLIRITKESLDRAIAVVRPGARVGDIGAAVQTHVEAAGFGIVRQFVGHGVGRELHEEPQIPNFGRAGTGPELFAGMVLAIEPMVTAGNPAVHILDDGWTAVTADTKRAAHFEHTILVTETGAEVLTTP
ncbi:MAG: type I methionyl aminopeptidase [bacterium]|nr:type I methionyl aminopeptidase [bacterium]